MSYIGPSPGDVALGKLAEIAEKMVAVTENAAAQSAEFQLRAVVAAETSASAAKDAAQSARKTVLWAILAAVISLAALGWSIYAGIK